MVRSVLSWLELMGFTLASVCPVGAGVPTLTALPCAHIRGPEAVGHAVAVVVTTLELRKPAIDAVACAQDDRGEHCRDARPDEDSHLDVVVAWAPGAEGELADEQAYGEPDARQQ